MDREHLNVALERWIPSESRRKTAQDGGVTNNTGLYKRKIYPLPIDICRRLLWGAILGLSSVLVLISAAGAETRERHLILNSDGIPSFASLVERAEELAKSAIAKEFRDSPEVGEVSILILGDRNGQIVPVLRSTVSRSDWQQDPSIESRTRYFSNYSELLLSYKEPEEPSPAAAPPPKSIEDDPAFRDD